MLLPEPSSKRGKGKLISESEAHLGMLQHVIKAQVLDLIFRSVYLLVGVLKLGLDDKSRRIPIPARRRMVGAGVTAPRFYIRHITILHNTLVIALPRENAKRLTVVMTPLMNSVKPLST